MNYQYVREQVMNFIVKSFSWLNLSLNIVVKVQFISI